MRVPAPGERLAVSVRLYRAGHSPFVAGIRGVRRPLTAAVLIRLALRRRAVR
jgi:DUF1365 family protein